MKSVFQDAKGAVFQVNALGDLFLGRNDIKVQDLHGLHDLGTFKGLVNELTFTGEGAC